LDITFTERCCDIMETELVNLDVGLRPRLSDVRAMLDTFAYRGFPLVDGTQFLGYVRRSRLESALRLLEEEQGRRDQDELRLDDLCAWTDFTVMRMVPDAPLSQAHQVFKQLGCQHIFVVGGIVGSETNDALLGILSKKSFLRFLKDGRVGHMPTTQYTTAAASPLSGPSHGGGGVSPRRDGMVHRVSGELITALEAAHHEDTGVSSNGEEQEPPDSSPGEETGGGALSSSWIEASARWFASSSRAPPPKRRTSSSRGGGDFGRSSRGTDSGRSRSGSRRGASPEAAPTSASSPSEAAGSPPGQEDVEQPRRPSRVASSSAAEVFEPP